MKRLSSLLPVAAIVVAGALAYSNSLHGEFVFDDDTEIVTKTVIRDLGRMLGPEGYRNNPNRVVGYVTLALNYRAGGLDPTGYHLANLAVHLAAALLVYALVVTTFRTPWLRRSALAPSSRVVAVVAGLLFVTHPIQTQAVTYVVQRFASLATLLYVAAVLLYARWRIAREAGRARGAAGAAGYAAVLLALLLAMKTKEIALTAPVAIALYETAFFEGPWRRRLAWLVPILATTHVNPAATVDGDTPLAQALGEVASIKVQTTLSRLDYLATQLVVVVRYLRLVALPVGQNLDYDFPVYRSFVDPAVAGSGLLLLALAAAGVIAWGGPVARWTRTSPDPAARLVAFGIAWFFVALSVESSVIPIVDVIVEHRVYLPSVGLFAAVATAGALLARRTATARWAAATVAVGAALALVLGIATWRRNQVWATELSLWSDVVAKAPGKSRAQDNLGLAYAHRNRHEEAAARFQEAVRLDPTNVRAWNNLGVAIAVLGWRDEARAAFGRALALDPKHAESIYNLGRILLMDEHRYEESVPYFLEAIRCRADYAEAYASLAAAWNALGRYPDTVRLLTGAGEVIRDQPHARFNLGVALAETGDVARARGEQRALQVLDPSLAAELGGFLARRTGPP